MFGKSTKDVWHSVIKTRTKYFMLLNVVSRWSYSNRSHILDLGMLKLTRAIEHPIFIKYSTTTISDKFKAWLFLFTGCSSGRRKIAESERKSFITFLCLYWLIIIKSLEFPGLVNGGWYSGRVIISQRWSNQSIRHIPVSAHNYVAVWCQWSHPF